MRRIPAPTTKRRLDDRTLSDIEKKFAAGLTSSQLLQLFEEHGVHLSEATLRKYVQLGLLPRSVRVGQKGKHTGSKGVYPVGVVRQIVRIRDMMAENYTIEQIQRDFLFVRSDIEQLQQTLGSIFETLVAVLRKRSKEGYGESMRQEVDSARALSKDLVARLVAIESKLMTRARLKRVSVS